MIKPFLIQNDFEKAYPSYGLRVDLYNGRSVFATL